MYSGVKDNTRILLVLVILLLCVILYLNRGKAIEWQKKRTFKEVIESYES